MADVAALPAGNDADYDAPLRRRVLLANAAALLVAEASRGLVLASMYHYLCAVLEPGGGTAADAGAWLGLAVAVFSAGRLVASVALAWAAERGTPYRRLLLATFALHAAGAAAYAGVAWLPAGGAAAAGLLVASRFVVGCASGTLGTCRAVVADASAPETRTRAFAGLSLAKFVGYALTPGVAVLITSDSAPGWVGVATCTLGALAVSWAFPRHFSACAPLTARRMREVVVAVAAGDAPSPPLPAPPPPPPLDADTRRLLLRCAAVFLLVNLVTKGVLAAVEAALAPSYAGSFGPGGDPDGDVVQDTGELMLALGLAGLVMYACMAAKPTAVAPAAPAAPAAPTAPTAPARAAAVVVALPTEGVCERLLPPGNDPDSATAATAWVVDASPLQLCRVDSARNGHHPHDEPSGLIGGGDSGVAVAPHAERAHSRPLLAWLAAVAASRADALDVALLLGGLAITAGGCALVAPGANAPDGVPMPRLVAGLALVWSVGAPLVDVLAVSCLSVLVSRAAPGSSQAGMLGAVSVAGSVGRIGYPLLFGVAGVGGTLAAAAGSACAAGLAVAALYACTPAGRMAGIGLLRVVSKNPG